jgi:preprotein translocase subunit SecY
MASAAEQLAANMSLGAFSKATELHKRLWFTLGALVIYRLGTYIPVPGIDATVMASLMTKAGGGLIGMFDMFSGGALRRMTVFALAIMPYITASIIMQLMASAVPALETLKKEGESGRIKINQYTRYLTVLIATVQAYGVALGLETQTGVVLNPGLFFVVTCVVTLVGGTVFLMWIGEQITARGVGNGSSLIIFAGIVANLPTALASILELGRTGGISGGVILMFAVAAAAVIAFVVFMESAQRRVLVQYPKRQVGNKVYGGDSTHMPLKVNVSGVIPPIFASSMLLIPAAIFKFGAARGMNWMTPFSNALSRGHLAYLVLYGVLITFFTFFYTAVAFNPQETAENLKKNGGFIPGIRPGSATADYFDYVLSRLSLVAAGYLTIVVLLPEMLMSKYGTTFYFGGTSLMIMVSVTMDTVTQVQSHLLAHQYEGLIRKNRGKGRLK